MKYAALFLVLLVMGSEAGAKSALEDAKLKSMAINHPANGSPSTYRNDAEELKSVGAYYQNAAGAYARGYSGKIYNRSSDGTYLGTSGGRVIVAVVDSGVDVNHADLAANVLKTKAVKCTISAGCTAHTTDATGHGPNSAGMIGAIKNGIGMHGVAFGSYILPVAALISGGSDILAFNYSLDQGAKVINASYGLEGRAGEIPIVTANTGNRDSAATSTQIQAYLAATERGVSLNNIIDKVLAKDAIVVFASGNAGMDQVGMLAGLPYYFRGNLASKPSGYTTVNPLNKDLSKNWVAAGAVNVTVSSGGALSYSIASYSNRCGVAKDWCLVAPFAAAPGYIDKVIYTTKAGGGYKYNMGTSFAAPSVSGAIAILKGAFPHLKSKDIMNVLYNTATDIGAVGVDTVYGRGMINLDKATNPSDAKWKITLANSYTLLNVSFSASGLNLSSAFGNALSKVAKEEIMFLDEYDKNYHIKLGALLGQSSTNRVAADQILAEFGEGELSNRVNFGDIEMGFAKTSNDYENIGRIDDPTSDLDNDFKAAFSSTTISSSKASATNKFTHNLNLANELSPAVLSTEINNQFSHSKAFKNPYLGFAESVDSGTFEYQKDGLGFKSGAFF
ncbi:MAG: S8 family peptidase, partial [Rickettsiales bacterium]